MFDDRRKLRPRPSLPPELPDIEDPEPMPMTAPGGFFGRPTPYRQPSRAEEMSEARNVYNQKQPGRLKAGLLGALQTVGAGGAQDLGQAFGQGIGGFVGGLINPRGVRNRQFEQQIRPQIEERFQLEDRERALRASEAKDQQDAEFQQARIADINSQIRTREAPKPIPRRQPIRSDRGLYDPDAGAIIPGTEPLPAAPKVPAPQLKFGRDKRGRFTWYNAADKLEAAEHTPMPPAFAQPKAKAAAKPKKQPKNIGISDVRAYAEENKLTESQAIAKFANDGWTVRR